VAPPTKQTNTSRVSQRNHFGQWENKEDLVRALPCTFAIELIVSPR
jgi:hypothetical protein